MKAHYSREPVGAHYGLTQWLLQRFTALVMAAYTVFAIGCVLLRPPDTYAQWKALFSGGFFRLATMLFFVALIYHAWVGMRDILVDYAKPYPLRLAAQAAVAIVLAAYLLWSFSILWGR